MTFEMAHNQPSSSEESPDEQVQGENKTMLLIFFDHYGIIHEKLVGKPWMHSFAWKPSMSCENGLTAYNQTLPVRGRSTPAKCRATPPCSCRSGWLNTKSRCPSLKVVVWFPQIFFFSPKKRGHEHDSVEDVQVAVIMRWQPSKCYP